jgi:two-component system response regulator AtoC
VRTQPDQSSGATQGAYFLTVCAPGQTSSPVVLLPGRTYTIGRQSSSHVPLEYPWVSKHHAIVYGGEPPEIEDVGSRNGTVMAGQPLTPGRRYPLGHESVVSIGGVSLLVHRTRTDHDPYDDSGRSESPAARSGTRALGLERSLSSGLVVSDPKSRELYAAAIQVAASDVSVLIQGETGVGKELFARAIHEHSRRCHRPLYTVNCAAIPENLVESELFGYKRGAFSGAVTSKPGLFEAAHGSTLLLDEIGELPRTVQAKLLRVLEMGEVVRLGAVRSTRVDVRIVAATNRDLAAEIANGTFRADLFYRLNGMTLAIPPLRERPEDIPLLAAYFAGRCVGGETNRLTDDAVKALLLHPWPGNVRELRSVIERAVVMAGGGQIDASRLTFDPPAFGPEHTVDITVGRADLMALTEAVMTANPGAAFRPQESPTGAVARELAAELDKRERRRIREALERAGGNQKDAASLLGISRRTLINRLERYGIARPRKRGCDQEG